MANQLKELERLDAVAAERARNKRVRAAVSEAKTGMGRGLGAILALRKKKGKK